MGVVDINKSTLSEISLYHGTIIMPKGFEINQEKLSTDILSHQFQKLSNPNTLFPFSRTWDMLNTYIREHIMLEYGFSLINKNTWGNIYYPNEKTFPILNIDPVDLRNSPDYVLLYGIQTKDCFVKIHYDDNRRKGRSWDIELKTNKFIMFPATSMYYITNKDSSNIVQTITYQYI